MCENVSPLFLTPLERFLTPLSTAVDTWTHAIPLLLLLLLLTRVKGAAEISVFPCRPSGLQWLTDTILEKLTPFSPLYYIVATNAKMRSPSWEAAAPLPLCVLKTSPMYFIPGRGKGHLGKIGRRDQSARWESFVRV